MQCLGMWTQCHHTRLFQHTLSRFLLIFSIREIGRSGHHMPWRFLLDISNTRKPRVNCLNCAVGTVGLLLILSPNVLRWPRSSSNPLLIRPRTIASQASPSIFHQNEPIPTSNYWQKPTATVQGQPSELTRLKLILKQTDYKFSYC